MKELTNEEKVLIGRLWDSGLGINSIAIFIIDKRNEMDTHYMASMVASELTGRVAYEDEGWG
jgi:hypothetical protein